MAHRILHAVSWVAALATMPPVTTSSTPAPHPIPCATLLQAAGIVGSDRVTPQTVGRIFGAALALRSHNATRVPRTDFDLAYMDTLACFPWATPGKDNPR